MDALSEVLRLVRLSGVIHVRAEFTEPWAVSSSPKLLADRLKIASESLAVFHAVVDGGCFIRIGKFPEIRVEAGDVVVLPRGDVHAVASDLDLPPVPMRDIYPFPSLKNVAEVKYGGSGKTTRIVCGFLHSDHRFGPLAESLPALICVRKRGGEITLETLGEDGRQVQAVVQPHEADWWRSSLRYLISEATVPGPGNHIVLARLAEFLFMEVLRWQLRYDSENRSGWLAGLRDPQVGKVLALLHGDPAQPWSVEKLAQHAGISRAVLAKRFVELVGEPPMQYLAEWRMHLARRLLCESTMAVGEIAGRVGYESEAAFNRAFRRLVGAPPSTWRRGRCSLSSEGNTMRQEKTVATG